MGLGLPEPTVNLIIGGRTAAGGCDSISATSISESSWSTTDVSTGTTLINGSVPQVFLTLVIRNDPI
jgi:hypothetical protein